MAIRKKPEPKPQLNPSKHLDTALAFVQKASVNQAVAESQTAVADTKKPIMLKLWASELAMIDEAVAMEARAQTYSRKRITRHGWIIEAIFEKIKRGQGQGH